MVAGKQMPSPGKAQMVCHVAGGVDRLDLPVAMGDRLAIAQADLRAEGEVNAFAAADEPLICQRLHSGAAAVLRRPESEDSGTCTFAKRRGKRRMVKMRMRHKYMADPLARFQCR